MTANEEWVTVTDKNGPGAMALCTLLRGEGQDKDNLAMIRVEETFEKLSGLPDYREWPAQPRLLHAITRIVMAQEGGRRDQEREQKVFSLFIQLYGLEGLAKMMGVKLSASEQPL